MYNSQPGTIVFITGAFISNSSWDAWRIFFEDEGYITIAPPWPHKDAAAEQLRKRHPDLCIASIRFRDLANYYAEIVRRLPEKPILLGHALGGIIAQVLVNRNLAAAGVAVHSYPAEASLQYEFSFWKAIWKSLGFFTSTQKTYLISFKNWQHGFTNGMFPYEQQTTYERFAVPESKLLVRDIFTSAVKVDFTKKHAPLLFLAGSEDSIVPAALISRNFRKYKSKDSITEYKLTEGRNHLAIFQSTWKQDADYILGWLATIIHKHKENNIDTYGDSWR